MWMGLGTGKARKFPGPSCICRGPALCRLGVTANGLELNAKHFAGTDLRGRGANWAVAQGPPQKI